MPLSSRIIKSAPVEGTAPYPGEEGAGAGASPVTAAAAEPAVRDGAPPAAPEAAAQVPESRPPDREEVEEKWAAAGYAQGKAKAEAECRRLREEAALKLREAEQSLSRAHRRAREIIAASEKTVVRLAVAAAESLLRCQLELAPEKILHVVRETARSLPEGEPVVLYVNPADLPACLQHRDSLRGELVNAPSLEIAPDESLARGSCRGETDSGIAEYLQEAERARIEERLMEVARAEERRLLEEEDGEYGRH